MSDFSGNERTARPTFLAKNLSDRLGSIFWSCERLIKYFRNWGKPSKSGKKGRPTVAANMLLGSRNAWRSFFQLHWPEIGCRLLVIRDKRASTLRDIQAAIESVKGRQNADIASVFWLGSPRNADLGAIRENRTQASALHFQIQDMRRQISELCGACREAETALQEATSDDLKSLQREADLRNSKLTECKRMLGLAEVKSSELDKLVRDQEAYWYCDQLLDFLRSRRYAVEPDKLAHALAGLEHMKWRQSMARCSDLPVQSFVQFPFSVVRTLSRIWDRRPGEFERAPVEFFRTELLKLPKSDWDAKDHLYQSWRDLRLAIEECWKSQPVGPYVPFVISSAFLRKIDRPKSPVDRVLDSQEALGLTK